jgi:hypothetical protein
MGMADDQKAPPLAKVHVAGLAGPRAIAFSDFHPLPEDTPQRGTNLEPNEIVTAVELPARGFGASYTHLYLSPSVWSWRATRSPRPLRRRRAQTLARPFGRRVACK